MRGYDAAGTVLTTSAPVKPSLDEACEPYWRRAARSRCSPPQHRHDAAGHDLPAARHRDRVAADPDQLPRHRAGARSAAVRVTGSRSGRHGGQPARALRRQRRELRRREGVPAGRAGHRPLARADLRLHDRPPARAADGRVRASCRASGAAACSASRRAPTWRRPRSPSPAVTEGRAPGLIFLGAKSGRGQDGPMIVDEFGNLVWFNAIGNRELATDFRVQSYQGKPVLTWWQGRLIGGEGRGEGVIYDTSYRPVRRVRAGNGMSADLHEFELTPQGTALLLIYDAVRRDLRHVGGSRRGVAVQAVVQEIDIATGLVLFEWHSLGNIGLSESHEQVPEAQRPVGLHARQLGRARRLRGLHRLRAPHLVRAADLARERPDPVAAGRLALGLPHGGGDAVLEPARRAPAARRDADAVRQQRAAAAARGVARDHAAARHRAQDGHAGAGAQAPREPALRDPGRRAAAAGRRDVRRLGLAPLLHRVRRRGPRRARRALRRRRRQLPRLQVPVERPAGPAAGARRLAAREPRRRARELERGDRRSRAGSCGPGSSANALRRIKGQPYGGFETAVSAVTRGRFVQVRALDAAGAVLGASATIRTDSSAR